MDDNVGDLYILLDGTHADPADCDKGDDGVLRHKSGVPVAMGKDGPLTVAEQAVDGKNILATHLEKDVERMGVEAATVTPRDEMEDMDAAEHVADEPVNRRMSTADHMLPDNAPRKPAAADVAPKDEKPMANKAADSKAPDAAKAPDAKG